MTGSSSGSGKPDARRRLIAEVVQPLHSIFRSVDTFSKRSLKTFGVTGPQIWALRTVHKAGVLTVGELTRQMYLHISTVSGIVDRLEAAGLLTRERQKPDRRIVHLRLTSRGRAVLKRTPEPPRSKISSRVQRLKDGELRQLRWAVQRLSQLMDIVPEKIEAPTE